MRSSCTAKASHIFPTTKNNSVFLIFTLEFIMKCLLTMTLILNNLPLEFNTFHLPTIAGPGIKQLINDQPGKISSPGLTAGNSLIMSWSYSMVDSQWLNTNLRVSLVFKSMGRLFKESLA